MHNNPYAAPSAPVQDHVETRDDAVAIREAHVRHEVTLKSVGSLYGLGSFMMMFGAIVSIVFPLTARGDTSQDEAIMVLAVMSAIYLVVGIGLGFMAFGFRTLRPWVKIPGTILSGLGLLAIPVGTLIHGYILYQIWCAQGQRVLSPDYRDIIARTPQVRYRRTVGDWIALGIVVLGLLGLAALLLSSLLG